MDHLFMSSLDLLSPRFYQHQYNSTHNIIFTERKPDHAQGKHLKIFEAHITGQFERPLVLSYVDPVSSIASLAFEFY